MVRVEPLLEAGLDRSEVIAKARETICAALRRGAFRVLDLSLENQGSSHRKVQTTPQSLTFSLKVSITDDRLNSAHAFLSLARAGLIHHDLASGALRRFPDYLTQLHQTQDYCSSAKEHSTSSPSR